MNYLKLQKTSRRQKNSTVTKQFSKKIVVYIIVCLLMLIMKIPIFQDMAENETFTVIGMVSEITNGPGSGIKYAFVVEEHSNEKYKLRPTKSMIYNGQIKEGFVYEIEYYKNSGVIKNITSILTQE